MLECDISMFGEYDNQVHSKIISLFRCYDPSVAFALGYAFTDHRIGHFLNDALLRSGIIFIYSTSLNY